MCQPRPEATEPAGGWKQPHLLWPKDAGTQKSIGSQEQNNNRKRLPEKPKPNRLIVKVPEETDKENEKSKKNKKLKSDAKAGPNSSCHDGKEVDEGAWEPKISHKEKPQHRKCDKVLTGSGSLGFN